MNLKKLSILALAIITGAALLTGCGSDSASGSTKKELSYSKSQGPYSELFEQGIKPILEKKGYKLTGKDMSDLLQADVALNEGEVDFNVEQHTAYMENFNEKQGGVVPYSGRRQETERPRLIRAGAFGISAG